MYTKKLLRSTWNIKEVLSLVAVFAVIVVIFSFLEFQDARGDVDDLLKKSGTLSQEQIDKLSVVSPVGIMAMVGALGFGVAYTAQMFSLSLQVNVTRKHLHKAILFSELMSAGLISATVYPVRMGINLLFSKLCTGQYAVLSDKFRDAAFNTSPFSKNMIVSQGILSGILLMLFGSLLFALIGSLLMIFLSRFKGAAAVFASILCFLSAAGILIALILISSKWISIAVLGSLLVIMLVAQWRLVKTQTIDNTNTRKKV